MELTVYHQRSRLTFVAYCFSAHARSHTTAGASAYARSHSILLMLANMLLMVPHASAHARSHATAGALLMLARIQLLVLLEIFYSNHIILVQLYM